MLCLSGFELYSRWVPLVFKRKAQAVCLGRQARNSQFFRKFPPLFSISSKNQLKMWSSHDSVSWTKIGFACRPFFFTCKKLKASASKLRHLIGSYKSRLLISKLQCYILWDICIFPSSFIWHLNVPSFLHCLVLKTALLWASIFNTFFSCILLKMKIKIKSTGLSLWLLTCAMFPGCDIEVDQ